METGLRRISDGEGMKLRDIRLRLLADVPWRSNGLTQERSYPSPYWDERARMLGTASGCAGFVYEDGTGWVGIVEVWVSEQLGAAECQGLWVDRPWRRRGLALALLQAACQWASGAGAGRVCAWVRDQNEPAMNAYVRAGFTVTEEVVHWPLRCDWQVLVAKVV
jgi:GNAT superfamily N-acetyltransferase